ncbi:MAG: type I DNA topoisomerase [Bacteroidetes bacterium]|nr:type I DNA topoisomerase [Bacteroidota bacterium]MDA1120079.1 type I DNA topoisomerase [Bacteroidota bacterium]
MPKNLVIVESPAKAKTIEGYLGKDFKVASSYGHVRDLPKGGLSVDVDNGFLPTYEIQADKKAVIKELKKLAKDAEIIYLASDGDREGEAISWHLKEALDLNDSQTRRIVFHEITKNAIQNALQNPRGIDLNLVNAQQARRVLDRLVGFEISPILWRKIKGGLSAGRVQSVAVRLVVDREREIDGFNSSSSFKITAHFIIEKGKILNAELPKKFESEDQALAFLEKCIEADFFIEKLETKPSKKSPAPPFTTSTLQQEASRKLSFSVSQTMTLAQKLYESGKITYMRTDSLNLSEEAINAAASAITGDFGSEYSQSRRYKTKSKSAQEAHEAIRPTDFRVSSAGKDYNENRLYELIWKRAIASQISDAQIEKTIATVGISNNDLKFTASGEVIKFDGFLKVYIESTDDENSDEQKGMLPPLAEGQVLELKDLTSRETFTRPAPRYTEASLVKKLEEMGIGRPSTYAPTISTIQKRGYISKETREGRERKFIQLVLANRGIERTINTETTGYEKQKLFPTNIAMVVNDFLVDHFPNVVDFSFTANVEKEFDEIALGEKPWDSMISDFYSKFHSTVEETKLVERSEVNKSRELGKDPASERKVYARLGKFGPVIQIGESDDDDKKFASMRQGQFIESISLEEALDLFQLPRNVGVYEEEEVIAAIGKFGPYVKHNGKFYSLGKELDPLSVSIDEATALINTKRTADANMVIKAFEGNDEIQVLNGRYGPYIKAGKKNVKIPKDQKPEDLTLQECVDLAEKTPEKKFKGKRK